MSSFSFKAQTGCWRNIVKSLISAESPSSLGKRFQGLLQFSRFYMSMCYFFLQEFKRIVVYDDLLACTDPYMKLIFFYCSSNKTLNVANHSIKVSTLRSIFILSIRSKTISKCVFNCLLNSNQVPSESFFD